MTGARSALRAWCGRHVSVLVVAVAAAAVTVLPPYANGPAIRSDGAGYHIWTYAILKGDLTFSWFRGDPEEVSLHRPDPAAERYTCKYPPGVALLRLPVMACVTNPARNGPPYSPTEHFVCLSLGAAALVATAALGLDTSRRLGAAPVWAHGAVLALTFGTGLYHYGTYDAGFSHVYSALLVAGLVWLAARAGTSGRPLPVAPVAALVALLVLVRTTNVVLIGSWLLGCGLWPGAAHRSPRFRFRAACAVALGGLAGTVATLAVNRAMFGRFTFHTYPGEEFRWQEPHMWDVLFDARNGALSFYPVLAVALVAAALARPTRVAALGLAGVFAAYTVLYGHWWSWQLGEGFGHRGFVEAVPLAVPVLAKALSSLTRPVSNAVTVAGTVVTAYTVLRMGDYWGSKCFY